MCRCGASCMCMLCVSVCLCVCVHWQAREWTRPTITFLPGACKKQKPVCERTPSGPIEASKPCRQSLLSQALRKTTSHAPTRNRNMVFQANDVGETAFICKVCLEAYNNHDRHPAPIDTLVSLQHFRVGVVGPPQSFCTRFGLMHTRTPVPIDI